jgi:peptidoglycan hydrolase-like protein with peptidoglycan-binding domain
MKSSINTHLHRTTLPEQVDPVSFSEQTSRVSNSETLSLMARSGYRPGMSNSERLTELQQQRPSFPMGTILRTGSRGELVVQLQTILQQVGFSVIPDGVFGPKTDREVRAYQRTNGLMIDGVAGTETLSRIGSMSSDSSVNEEEEVYETQTMHNVFPGENLWGIAQQYYGDGSRWKEIAKANQLSEASVLRVGMVLTVPNVEAKKIDVEPLRQGVMPAPFHPVYSPLPGDGMRAPDPIDLSQLSGLQREMAEIYNEKGTYLYKKATALGVSTSAVAAILQCESNGKGFSSSGDMIIRFENHIFWDKWGDSHQQQFAEHFQFNPNKRWKNHLFRSDVNNPWESFHSNQSKEWEVLNLARELSDSAALESISMGAAQVMGFNYKMIGYDSVQDMFQSMTSSLPAQLDGMFSYIEASSTCMRGLKSNDFYTFASGYNGPGNAQVYGNLITIAEQNYRLITQGRQMV